MLLNARGQKRLHAFALSEIEFFPLRRMRPTPIHASLKHAAMQFPEAIDPSDYGRTFIWDNKPLADTTELLGLGIHLAEGLQILHLQKCIL